MKSPDFWANRLWFWTLLWKCQCFFHASRWHRWTFFQGRELCTEQLPTIQHASALSHVKLCGVRSSRERPPGHSCIYELHFEVHPVSCERFIFTLVTPFNIFLVIDPTVGVRARLPLLFQVRGQCPVRGERGRCGAGSSRRKAKVHDVTFSVEKYVDAEKKVLWLKCVF